MDDCCYAKMVTSCQRESERQSETSSKSPTEIKTKDEALCRSFTRSPRVVLRFLLTVLMIILTPRDEILRGAPDGGRLSVVSFTLPSLVQVYNFPGVLRQLFALGHSGVWSLTVLRLWTGVFYTDKEFKQVPLIQVTSGGQKSFLKKKLQVCESQRSSLFEVTKYLFSTIIYK
ncbi:uncharacterized protein LOC133538135 isoform X4 [Nerophis ophidion]|uniref:uncharacterized protein LOC133538135 isoform X4 n=1 Tax=Nerophis ophidion TaxID=159077 RepID=UPI002AE0AB13|nr:uncharacterized protein LOC133538135 isoform X4 [Nerophis ophidion]